MATRTDNEHGFTLVEVLLVLGIMSILSVLMVVSMNGARQIGLTTQAISTTQQNARTISSIIERDLRETGSGLFTNSYREKNGGQAGEVIGAMNPDSFDYELTESELEGVMVPPLEVVDGTDSDGTSYLNPVASTIGLTSYYRESATDMLTVYSTVDSGFSCRVSDVADETPEKLQVTDAIVGARMKELFDAQSGKPMLVMILDNEGKYSLLRKVTAVTTSAGEYKFQVEAINDVNQPDSIKTYLTALGLDLTAASGDTVCQISVVNYFIYSSPDISQGARNWLVRLDLQAIIANGLNLDATNPDSIRPFVLAEHVQDFQVALGIDADDNGTVDAAEWINDNTMEDYAHLTPGTGTVSASFMSLVNNLREVRFSVVTITDASTEENTFGFAKRDDPNFYTMYPTVESVAEAIGISPQLEDHQWYHTQLVYELWYHRGVQQTRNVKIRNLDLENTFARKQ